MIPTNSTMQVILQFMAKRLYERTFTPAVRVAGGTPRHWEELTAAEQAGWVAVDSSTLAKDLVEEIDQERRRDGRLHD